MSHSKSNFPHLAEFFALHKHTHTHHPHRQKLLVDLTLSTQLNREFYHHCIPDFVKRTLYACGVLYKPNQTVTKCYDVIICQQYYARNLNTMKFYRAKHAASFYGINAAWEWAVASFILPSTPGNILVRNVCVKEHILPDPCHRCM